MIHILKHSLAFLLYSFPLLLYRFFFSPPKENILLEKTMPSLKTLGTRRQVQQAQGTFWQEMIPSVTRPVSWAGAHNWQEGKYPLLCLSSSLIYSHLLKLLNHFPKCKLRDRQFARHCDALFYPTFKTALWVR